MKAKYRTTLLSMISGVLAWASVADVRAGDAYRLLEIDGQTVRWHPERPGRLITLRYAIVDREREIAGATNCKRIRPPTILLSRSKLSLAQFRAATRRAFDKWQGANMPTFVETESVEDADILVGEQAVPEGIAYTNLTFAEGRERIGKHILPIESGQVCLNPEKTWKIGFNGVLVHPELVFTITHEVGHVLGLDHPGARGHLMSFRYSEDHPEPTNGDLVGMHRLYDSATIVTRRADTSPRSGRNRKTSYALSGGK